MMRLLMSFFPILMCFSQTWRFFSERRRRFLTEKGAEGAPDLVVEILSPKTAHLDLDQKRVVYSPAGVDELWIVDPAGEEVRVYHLREDPNLPKVILRSGDVLQTPVLPGFEISVKKIFRRF
jgi:Uma2 family endonuclease